MIVMRLVSGEVAAAAAAASGRGGGGGNGGTLDPNFASILVVFNARPTPYTHPYPPACAALSLHPALSQLAGDEAVGGCRADGAARVVEVAGRTAAVFVEQRR